MEYKVLVRVYLSKPLKEALKENPDIPQGQVAEFLRDLEYFLSMRQVRNNLLYFEYELIDNE